MRNAVIAALICTTLGCGHQRKMVSTTTSSRNAKKSAQADYGAPLSDVEREQFNRKAVRALGHQSFKVGNTVFSHDALGFIKALLASIGKGLSLPRDYDSVKGLYHMLKKRGAVKDRPSPGDLVFFHNTFDQSRNGRMDDAFTHVGIVEKVEGNTVSFIHFQVKTVIRSRMNLSFPALTHDQALGKRINHILRRAQGDERAYTAAELFAGFGRI